MKNWFGVRTILSYALIGLQHIRDLFLLQLLMQNVPKFAFYKYYKNDFKRRFYFRSFDVKTVNFVAKTI